MSDDVPDAGSGPRGGAEAATAVARSRSSGPAEPLGDAGRPLSPGEMRRALVRPDLMAAQVLGSVDRLAGNFSTGESLGLLTVVLAATSLVAAVPFGAFSPVGSFWKVSVLFTGSLLICLPSLHVLLQFLGFRITLVRNLSLSLVITATAALFTLGLCPIVWFIDLTTRAGDDSVVTPAGLTRALLGLSLLLGIVQMRRCLAASSLGDGGGMRYAIFAWVPLLVFIVWRMAGVLGLRG